MLGTLRDGAFHLDMRSLRDEEIPILGDRIIEFWQGEKGSRR